MDNLTHSLIGALFGQMGLKRKTGLAMPTLIIAANIPDIDAVAVLLGGHQHLALRRGITHGPIAMVLLPLLLWGAMIWFDNWQTRRGKRPEARLPVHKGWLLALAVIGCLSHPLFDWFNSYGIRLLEPFSSQWFYGDTLFIIDVWILAALGLGVILSLRRERAERHDWRRPAKAAFLILSAYIFANGAVTRQAEAVATIEIAKKDGFKPDLVIANPQPVLFWRREILWWQLTDGKSQYGSGKFDLIARKFIQLDSEKIDAGELSIEASIASETDREFRAFNFWSRMPVTSIRPSTSINGGVDVEVRDMRFRNSLVRDRFTVVSHITDDQLRIVD